MFHLSHLTLPAFELCVQLPVALFSGLAFNLTYTLLKSFALGNYLLLFDKNQSYISS